MYNLSSNCGIIDAKIRASEKDLPVIKSINVEDGFLFVEGRIFQNW
jgi:hypothetical protein